MPRTVTINLLDAYNIMEYESETKSACDAKPSLFELRNGNQRKLWLDLSVVERFDPSTDSGTPKAPRPNNYPKFSVTGKDTRSPNKKA